MQQSEQVTELFKAINQAQSNFPSAKKDSTNPHFRSNYADLTSIVEAIRGPLFKNGLSFVQPLEYQDGHYILTTQINHISGQFIRSSVVIPVVKNDPQGVGSAITYLRRYSLTSMLGVVADEDDDGNAGSNLPPLTANHVQNSTRTGKGPTEKQLGYLKAKAIEAKIEINELAKYIKQTYNKEPKDLLKDEFEAVLNFVRGGKS